ncbi:LuxR C-terminal-related transcriptional regulator [Microbacterium sp. LjRoot45]|uniref:response regulator transcription factor n=1 Tax=Microbacterium sp. LjRoot45 TaxID=3342329 RepID=UPI003ED037E5
MDRSSAAEATQSGWAGPITRVGLVEDQPAMVVGASAIINIRPDMHLTAAAPTVTSLLAQTLDLDVVLLDPASTPRTPVDDIRTLVAQGIAIVAYVSGDDEGAPHRVHMPPGIVGAVRTSDGPDALVAAIRAAARASLTRRAARGDGIAPTRRPLRPDLTPREEEVLALYAAGATADAVASALFISRNTVVDHIRNIRAKYTLLGRDVASKTALYRRALEDGLVRGD